MGRFQIPSLAYIRSDDQKYYSAFQAIEQAINNHSDQGNLDPASAQGAAPSTISGLNVVEKDGIHDVQITDNSPAYRGANYFAYYSQTPDFQNEHKVDMGASQNIRMNLGSGKYYWRAHSAYATSPTSAHVYHGGQQPTAVGTGNYSGPPMQAGQGGAGFGPQYRSSSTPPVRK